MIAFNLKTNYLRQAMGIDPGTMVLTWIPVGGLRQSAFQITVEAEGKPFYDTQKQYTSETEYVLPVQIPSRTHVRWTVTLWDENDAPGAPIGMDFETGMHAEDWVAQWIDPEPVQPEYCKLATDGLPLNRASYLRKEFTVSDFVKARLYITSHGVYDVWINGIHIDGYFMAPGATHYDYRLQVQTYDIGEQLHAGRNEILVTIGEGRWRGSTGWGMTRYCYGTDLALLCQLELDGRPVVCSDGTWLASQDGPLAENDTMRLERYDARKQITCWHSVKVADFGFETLVGTTVPVNAHEQFRAKLITTPSGQKVLDFGQNFAGYVSLDLLASGGEKLILTHGEVLDQEGNFQIKNFQNAKTPLCLQMVEYTCKPGRNQYHQTKCYYGFRYVMVETELPITGEEFTGVAVYSDMEQTSFFQCGNPDVNRLFLNTLWSMKSNFVDVPTDCPHREKTGFTGDCQVFSAAALYLMDSYPVLMRWLREIAAAQYINGCIPQISPKTSSLKKVTNSGMDGSAGWSNAYEIITYRMMQRLNSTLFAKELYPGIKRWMLYNLELAKQTRPENADIPLVYRDYILDCGNNWGEWNEPGWTSSDYFAESDRNGHAELATGFLAYGCLLVHAIAHRLGETEDALFFYEAYEKVRAAYRYVFTDDGVITSERQCHYVRPIAHELLSESEKQAAADILIAMIRNNGNKLGTGFLTTCYLCDVLTDLGYSSVAYDLLLQTECPSWLFAVQHGATTIWENWFAIHPNGERKSSHNHYAYGAVSEWLMSRVLGIVVNDGTITLRPYPDRRLGFAEGCYHSPLGKIGARWIYEGDEIHLRFEVPCNAEATVILPDGQTHRVAAGVHSFRTRA